MTLWLRVFKSCFLVALVLWAWLAPEDADGDLASRPDVNSEERAWADGRPRLLRSQGGGSEEGSVALDGASGDDEDDAKDTPPGKAGNSSNNSVGALEADAAAVTDVEATLLSDLMRINQEIAGEHNRSDQLIQQLEEELREERLNHDGLIEHLEQQKEHVLHDPPLTRLEEQLEELEKKREQLVSELQQLESKRPKLEEDCREKSQEMEQLGHLEQEIRRAIAMRATLGKATLTTRDVKERQIRYALGCGLAFSAVAVIGICCEARKQCLHQQGAYELVDMESLELTQYYVGAWTFPYLTLFLGASIACPILGAPTASCDAGVLWEYHTAFFAVAMLGKLLDLGFYMVLPSEPIGYAKLLMKFGASVLAIVDTYTDVCFVVIAHTCGSSLWVWALVFVVLGVIIGQYLILIAFEICFRNGKPGTSDVAMAGWFMVKACHFDIMLSTAPLVANAPLAARKPGSKIFGSGPFSSCMIAVMRLFLEDVAQSVIQVVFVLQVIKNPQVIGSIACALVSSIINTVLAVREFLQAVDASVN